MLSRTPAVVLTAALTLGVAACGTSNGGGSNNGGGGGGGGKIALLLPESKTTRYDQQDKPNFEARVRQLCSGCQVIYSNADQDVAKQQSQAEAALTAGAKVLVLDAVDVKAAAAIVNRARQSKVPVISYGRLVSGAPLDYYVSIDPFKVGEQQAQSLVKKLGGKAGARVIMINGSPTDSNAAPYKNGALSVFKKEGIKVVKSYDTPDWSPDKAQTEMDQAISSLGKNGFDAVYVANDGMATGAVAAMKGARIDPASKPVTGQDAELAGVQRVLSGEQLMTVYQPIRKIAETAAELAVPLAKGSKPSAGLTPAKVDNGAGKVPSALLDTIAITKNNVKSTVVKDGFLKTSDICRGQYKAACQSAGLGA
ncbi:MAG: sugar ABC transporter substrate-binding protein [Actinobacteria bacterium]|nr:MAG: sugar ABC transporter substrate-binding protein [Actinomycetota bacterium]